MKKSLLKGYHMKEIGIIMLSVIAFSACQNSENKFESISSTSEKTVGSDKDDHDCITSAGYTWSILRQDCIRFFEQGKKLHAVDQSQNKSAYIVYGEDQNKIELFLPDSKHNLILSKNEKGIFKNQKYKFDQKNAHLSINGDVKFKIATSL
ncbi:MAG: hypothetical protein ACTHY4_04310 [Flavobacteriaceae bacterium]